MCYKVSKYNYIVKLNNEWFLLFNSLKGRKSLYKVRRTDTSVLKYITQKDSITEENQITQKLLQAGFLIPRDYDEDQEIQEIFNQKVNDRTLNLIVAPTGSCNLRCKYCCEDLNTGKMSKEVQESIIQYIDKNISKYSSVNIDWFGGEPLLAMDVIENISKKVIEICKREKKQYSSFITTNGTLLTLGVFKKLYQFHVVRYQITIDGTRDIHDQQRVTSSMQPTFERIINNLKQIKNSNVGKHAVIMILTNYSDVMKDSIKEYKEFFSENFGDDKRFKYSCNIIMNLGGTRIEEYKQYLVGSQQMNYLYEQIIACEDTKLDYIYEEFLEPGSQLCYAAKKNSYLIGEDGCVYKCEHQYQILKDKPIGRLKNDGEMVLESDSRLWDGKFNYCKSETCKLKPLCLGEDCIKKRVETGNTIQYGEKCQYRECHFYKPTLEAVLKLIAHERNIVKEF
ncbi:MAG TPA: hypothetical protein DCW90_15700 [Lachnospiraceae bacterium]|nr:radical SAM protein [uncultured Lachnoclostridium sp.]HAU86874.1 hypothetical protein [Lachnospiraceae bacterium]